MDPAPYGVCRGLEQEPTRVGVLQLLFMSRLFVCFSYCSCQHLARIGVQKGLQQHPHPC